RSRPCGCVRGGAGWSDRPTARPPLTVVTSNHYPPHRTLIRVRSGRHGLRSRSRAGQVLLAGATVPVVAALVWGTVLIWPAADSTAAPPPRSVGAITATGSPSPEPSPTPSPEPSPTASSPAPRPEEAPPPAAPAPAPTRAPVELEEAPPPVAEPPPPDVECPYYEGENAPEAEVGAALEAAAARRFWTVSQVSLPPRLIKAVAEQESGWQSAIIACDGGIGTMQVMPNTADWMNQRFGTSY